MKILFVGFGSIAKKHLRAILEILSEPEIYALRSSENSPQIEGVKSIYHLDEVPAELDFVIVSNPTSSHAETIAQVSQFKCPVFIEKPIFHELNEETLGLAMDLQASGNITYVACNLRFHPVIQYLKDHLPEQGKINEVNVYCGSNLQNWRPDQNFRESYSSIPELGGGVHLDLIHEIDYTYWLFGKPEEVSKTLSSKSSLDIPAIDYANYCLKFADFHTSIILNYFRPKTKRTIEIVFEDTTWTANLLTCEIIDDNNNLVFKVDNYDTLQTYTDQMKYFLGCIKTENSTFNTVLNGVEVLEICLNKNAR